jgi:hypothetical protein
MEESEAATVTITTISDEPPTIDSGINVMTTGSDALNETSTGDNILLD